jgi:hypothetical protein
MSEGKIIDVKGAEAEAKSTAPAVNGNLFSATEPLTTDEVRRLVATVNRLRFLKGQKLATAETDAEIRGAQAYVVNMLLKHADEFIGGQWALVQEYDPLLNLISNVAVRVSDIISRRRAQIEATKKQIEENPVNE